MKRALLAFVAPLVGLVIVLTLLATPVVAGAQGQWQIPGRSAWQVGSWRGSEPDLSLVHGVPGLNVDIYVYKNVFSVKKLSDVTFGTVADLGADFPGWVTPGFYVVEVVPTGASPCQPLLETTVLLGWGQNKTVAAYVTASPSGSPGTPTLAAFSNDVASTAGAARVTVRHLAVAPTVGVYADGSVAVTPAFSNGQSTEAGVPAGSYDVTVTAPNTPSTVLDDLGAVSLPANTNTLAFAIGTYPSTFNVVTLQIPTR